MILAINVSNRNITIGVFDQDKLVKTFRISTQVQKTSDEYGVLLRELVRVPESENAVIDGIIIGSVVPGIMYSLSNGCLKYLGVKPLVIGPGMRTGVKLKAENPKEVGAGIIANCAAVHALYGGPAIVVDYGTATSFQLVLEDGTLDSVVIAPGILTGAKALAQSAAKISEVELQKPKTILTKETTECFQAGIFYGALGGTEYIVRRMKEESGFKDAKVIATGGIGKIISEESEVIDIFDSSLTLQGLRTIYEKNKSRSRRRKEEDDRSLPLAAAAEIE